MIHFVLLVLGFILLAVSSEYLIRNARSVSAYFRIPTYLFGIFVLSAGSNLPELIISIQASLASLSGQESSNIIIGDVIGSVIAQGSLVLGIIAYITYLQMPKKRALVHCSFLILSSLVLYFLCLDGVLNFEDGLVLLAFYMGYAIIAIYLKEARPEKKLQKKKNFLKIIYPISIIAVCFVTIYFAADLVVVHTRAIASLYGISDLITAQIGIGVGTSLPELVISIQALRKNEKGLLLGNIIGSNIYDTLAIPGLSALIHNVSIEASSINLYLPMLIALSVGLFVFLVRKKGIQKNESILLLLFFISFIAMNIYAISD